MHYPTSFVKQWPISQHCNGRMDATAYYEGYGSAVLDRSYAIGFAL